MKANAKVNIVYNCFPQVYSQCKVINTLGDLNMIRHLVPEASLQDKVDICSQKDKISECFLDWSKCEQSFKDEMFSKLFSPFTNKLNNLNTDDYETDIDKTKGFLDSQLLILGIKIKDERKVIIADMENHLNQTEPFTFKTDNGKYKVTALDGAAFLRNLEDTEKIAYFKDQEYLDPDLKAQEESSGRMLRAVPRRRYSPRSAPSPPPEARILETEGLERTVMGRQLEEEATPAYLGLSYEINEETGLDLRVWAQDSGLNVANLEDSMVTLPNIPDPVTVSISDPGGGDGGTDGSQDNGGDTNANNTGTTDTNQSAGSLNWLATVLTTLLIILG